MSEPGEASAAWLSALPDKVLTAMAEEIEEILITRFRERRAAEAETAAAACRGELLRLGFAGQILRLREAGGGLLLATVGRSKKLHMLRWNNYEKAVVTICEKAVAELPPGSRGPEFGAIPSCTACSIRSQRLRGKAIKIEDQLKTEREEGA